MSATIRNHSAVSITVGGVQRTFGGLEDPIGEATIDGDYIIDGRLTVPAEDYIVLWDQSMTDLLFDQVGFRIVGEGTLQVAWRTDLPTSSTDFTPLGTKQRWHHKDWPCKMAPFWLCSQTSLGHSTEGSETADNAGVPALWTTNLAGAVTMICDKVMLRNADEDAAVVIERLIAK